MEQISSIVRCKEDVILGINLYDTPRFADWLIALLHGYEPYR